MAAPNSVNTEHPIGGGQSPAYLGATGGQVGFFQDAYGAVRQAAASGNTLTVLTLTQGTIVDCQTSTSSNGLTQSGAGLRPGRASPRSTRPAITQASGSAAYGARPPGFSRWKASI